MHALFDTSQRLADNREKYGSISTQRSPLAIAKPAAPSQ